MIQFNLLPDVKLAYIKAERTKRLVTSISVLVGLVAITIFVLLFLSVKVVQKKSLSDLNKDIATNTSDIKKTDNLDKILTIQSQLGALDGLHEAKPVSSRLFGYVAQVTPSDVTIDTITTDFAANTISIQGAGPSLDAVNTYVDTLKFTTYTTDQSTTPTSAFSKVVLSGFGRNTNGATYTISLSYDPAIFKVDNKATLQIPQRTTTRSVTEQPTIFKDTTPSTTTGATR